jgi:hypothetical protein
LRGEGVIATPAIHRTRSAPSFICSACTVDLSNNRQSSELRRQREELQKIKKQGEY